MLKKTVDFFNVDLLEDILAKGYPKVSEEAVRTCISK